MPRVAQPGGLSQMMRVRYTVRRKLALLASAERIMEEEGVSLRRAAARLQVAHSLIVKWQQEQASNADSILAMLKSKKKSMHPGPLGQLKSLQDTLLRYVFERYVYGGGRGDCGCIGRTLGGTRATTPLHFLVRYRIKTLNFITLKFNN